MQRVRTRISKYSRSYTFICNLWGIKKLCLLQGVLSQRAKTLQKPPIELSQLIYTLMSFYLNSNAFLWRFILLKISANTSIRILILTYSIYETQKGPTSFLVLIKMVKMI